MYRPYSSPIGGSSPSMDVESTIRGLTQDFSMNFNTGNYDQVAALFGADGSFMAPHHEAAVGPKAIERKLREFGEAGYQDWPPFATVAATVAICSGVAWTAPCPMDTLAV